MRLILSITKYKSEHIETLIDFWRLSHSLYFLLKNYEGWELQDWITNNLYYDNRGDIWSNIYWPEPRCIEGYYHKHDFVAWQIAGYRLKELLDSKEIAVEITDGKDRFLPCWKANKHRVETGDIKTQIKAAKHEWSRKHETWGKKCKLRGKDITRGYIRICCVCNQWPIRVLRKINETS